MNIMNIMNIYTASEGIAFIARIIDTNEWNIVFTAQIF